MFADPFAVYLDDGSDTARTVVIGTSLRDRILYVVHVERGERRYHCATCKHRGT